jgi:hypothetical protein
MFLVKKSQMDIMNLPVKDRFINDTAKQLKFYYAEWCVNKSEIEIRQFVEEMTSFSHQHLIFESHNIFDLIHWEINFQFLKLLTKDADMRAAIVNTSKDEFTRINAIKICLIKHING